MRVFLAATVAALAIAGSAAAIATPVNENEGGTGWSCRWNPFAYLACNAGACRWVGQFQWYDPPGHPTGIPCV